MLAGLVALGLGGGWLARDRSLARLQTGAVWRVGYAVEPPYVGVERGRMTGEQAVIIAALAERLGVREVAWVQAEFDELLPGLAEGRWDVVAAGMFITPERARQVAFARPTVRARAALLVPAGTTAGWTETLANPAARLAVLAGSVEAAWLRATGVPETRLVTVPDARTGEAVVAAGLAEALALSAPTVRELARTSGGRLEARVALPGEASPPEGLAALAFRPADRAVRRACEAVLADYLGSEPHLAAIAVWGWERADVPGGLAAGEVPAR